MASPTAMPPAPAAAGSATRLNCSRRRKSRIFQSFSLAWARSAGSGFTATGLPTVDSMGMSLEESE